MFRRITEILGLAIIGISIFFYKYVPLNKILYILLFCMYSLFMIKEIKDTYPKVKVLSIVTYILILIGLSLAII